MQYSNWIYYILLLIVSLASLLINIVGLPGLWLMIAAVAGYAWLTRVEHFVGLYTLIALVVLGLVAEAMEFFAGAAGSKAAGGRKRGMVGGIVGALLGGLFLSVIPIPIISTILGACLGAFIGATIMELTDGDLEHATRVGAGAAKGRLMGIIIKSVIGLVMLAIAAVAALPV